MISTGIELQQFGHGSTNARFQAKDSQTGQWTLYASVGGTVLSEYTEFTPNVPAWTKSYTYLGDSQLSTITPNGQGGETTEFNHPDRLGTKLVTNQQTGSVSEQATLPFGRPLDAESSLQKNNKRFTSYDRSSITKLDYAVNRTYDSKLGRFTQVDPIGMGSVSLTSPQTLNLYAYCTNDPVNYTDPSGLGFFSFLKKVFKWVMIAIAVAAAVLTIVGTFVSAMAMTAFLSNTVLGQIMGFIANIPAMIGSSLFPGAGASIAGALGFTEGALSIATGMINSAIGWGVLAGAKAAVGAIASGFAGNRGQKKETDGARLHRRAQLSYLILRLTFMSQPLS